MPTRIEQRRIVTRDEVGNVISDELHTIMWVKLRGTGVWVIAHAEKAAIG